MANTDTDSIAPEVLDLLRQASTATITTQLFKRGLRNTFLAGLRPLNPECARFVGEAFTLRYIPAREDLDVVEVFDDYDHPQRRAVESVGPGQVLVMDCRQQTRAASGGHILMTRLLKRGAAGVVTDGALRDSPEIARMALPVFAADVSPMMNLAQHHAVDMQVAIACAGVAVYPGDILVGDEEGVVCVPRHLASAIAAPAAEQEALERFILHKVEGGAPLRGTYPPDQQTRAEFDRSR
jgi:regulator of RNase E activity RraA